MKEKTWPLKKAELTKITNRLKRKIRLIESSNKIKLNQYFEASQDVFFLEKTKCLVKILKKSNIYPKEADNLIRDFYKLTRNHKYFKGEEVDSLVSDVNDNFYNLYNISQDKLSPDSFKQMSYYMIKFYKDTNPDKKHYNHKEIYDLVNKALRIKKEGSEALRRSRKKKNILSFPETKHDFKINLNTEEIRGVIKKVFSSMNRPEINEIVSYVLNDSIIYTDEDMDTCAQFDHYGFWPVIITPKIETYIDLAILIHEIGHALHSVLTCRYCKSYQNSMTDILTCEFVANYFMNKFGEMSCSEITELDSYRCSIAYESLLFSRTYNEAFWLTVEDSFFNSRLADYKSCDSLFKKIVNKFYPGVRLKKEDINWESNTHFLDRFRTHDAFLSFVMSYNFLQQEKKKEEMREVIFFIMQLGEQVNIKNLIQKFGHNFSINILRPKRSIN